jgi:hypothetical protein
MTPTSRTRRSPARSAYRSPGTATRRSARDRQTGRKPNIVSALEITVRTDLQGTGLSGTMLAAMRDNAARLGFEHLVAPVRPNRKHLVPDMPIEEYTGLVRKDGLPQDPWLRVHVRAGGRIVGTCKRAMVNPGTLEEWRSWTGLPFDERAVGAAMAASLGRARAAGAALHPSRLVATAER